MPKTIRIAILKYDEALPSAVFGMQEMLASAAEQSTSRKLTADILESPRSGYDAYVLPPSNGTFETAHRADLIRFIQSEHQRGALICSVCAGLVWLAEARILGTRPVTTHWGLTSYFQNQYPDVVFDTDHILIEHADLMTAGGMMAWIDLTMALIERFMGRDLMIEMSRRFVVEPGRADQRRYKSFSPDLSHKDKGIRSAQLYVEAHFSDRLTVAQLAEVAGLSQRTFMRRFSSITGHAPLAYVQIVRMEKAKDRLIHADASVQTIAFEVGYSDLSAFSRKFQHHTGMTPTVFRKRFRLQHHPVE